MFTHSLHLRISIPDVCVTCMFFSEDENKSDAHISIKLYPKIHTGITSSKRKVYALSLVIQSLCGIVIWLY